jgi:hypothetical protein
MHLILRSMESPGDSLLLTVAVRDVRGAHFACGMPIDGNPYTPDFRGDFP